jgi:hypothetical protein
MLWMVLWVVLFRSVSAKMLMSGLTTSRFAILCNFFFEWTLV